MKLKQFRGCGDHGPCEGNTWRDKWDPWCLKCYPLPAPTLHFRMTEGQKEAKRLDRQKRGAA